MITNNFYKGKPSYVNGYIYIRMRKNKIKWDKNKAKHAHNSELNEGHFFNVGR